jgi:hypothetical protein
VPLGYVEAKDIGEDLRKVERSEQLKRYRGAFSNLILTDYLEFRHYVDGERRATARIAEEDENGRLIPSKGGAEEAELSFVQDGLGDLAETFGPEDVFH